MFWKRRRTSSTVDILTAAQFRFLETMMILILGVLTDEQKATIKETIRWRLGRMHEVPIPTFIPPAGAQSYRDALSERGAHAAPPPSQSTTRRATTLLTDRNLL